MVESGSLAGVKGATGAGKEGGTPAAAGSPPPDPGKKPEGEGADASPARQAYAKTPEGEYWVAKHKAFTPRGPDTRSHHGVISAWMEKHFPKYKPREGPAVHMPTEQHYRTTAVYNKWRADIERRTGGFDWKTVGEADMRKLSEAMFDEAKVPQSVRAAYWSEFERMLAAFREGMAI